MHLTVLDLKLVWLNQKIQSYIYSIRPNILTQNKISTLTDKKTLKFLIVKIILDLIDKLIKNVF
jgi:hypothetical protein